MVCIIVSIALLAFLMWSENGSQNCVDQMCHNKVLDILDEEDSDTMVHKILQSVDINHSIVIWRRALIVAIVSAIATYIVLLAFNAELGNKDISYSNAIWMIFISSS